jgi:hypothetical protein
MAKRSDKLGRAYKGSQLQIQIAVNRCRDELEQAALAFDSNWSRSTLLACMIVALLVMHGSSASEARGYYCGKIGVRAQSDEIFVNVRAFGIDCAAVRVILVGWARGGYQPRSGPPTFSCTFRRLYNKTRKYPGDKEYRCARTSPSGPQVVYYSIPQF